MVNSGLKGLRAIYERNIVFRSCSIYRMLLESYTISTLEPLSMTIVLFNPFYQPFKSQLLSRNVRLRNLKMIEFKLNKYESFSPTRSQFKLFILTVYRSG